MRARIIASERLWGGPAPLTVVDFDDFIIWITLGIILGGRTGYVLFYNLPLFVAHPLQIFELWNGGMSFHGGVLGCIVAIVWFALHRGIPMLSLGDVTTAVAPIGLFLGRIANFINGELWGRPTDVPWAMIFPNGGPIPRHPSQLYEAALEGVVLFIVLGVLVRSGALKRPGVVTGCFCARLRRRAHHLRILPRARRAARLSLGRAHHGNAAVHSADVGRHRHSCVRAYAANRSRKMADEISPLEAEIRRLIRIAGPMPVAEYMRLCLTHPQHGYYITRDPIGAGGDFITAPEISQMFGELIGLWMAAVWQQMGAPENVRLIELGPGRGTMMVDALRAAKTVPAFLAAIVLHLVEISPTLRQLQQQRLEPLGLPALWHSTLDDVPGGPCLIIANEFIDALPVHQAVKQGGGWHERVVEIGPDGKLVIGTARDPLPHFEATLPRGLRHSPDGSIYEWRSDNIAFELGRRVRDGGAALLIDYGHAWYGLGETLQAVSGHAYVDPLTAPGESI